jgi:hypothetical protein
MSVFSGEPKRVSAAMDAASPAGDSILVTVRLVCPWCGKRNFYTVESMPVLNRRECRFCMNEFEAGLTYETTVRKKITATRAPTT